MDDRYFPGTNENDQLLKIFKALGTPTPVTWPTIVDLPEYKPNFPAYPAQNMKKLVRRLDQSD